MTATIRTAQPGDVFVLLEPNIEEANEVRRRQMELQAALGGRISEPLHLTCQRFEVTDERRFDHVLETLKSTLQELPAFALTANGYIPLFSRFRQTYILKWYVQETPALRHLGALLESTLITARAIPYFRYSAGWIATLITALEGLPDLPDDHRLSRNDFPFHLFTARHVLVTRLRSGREFETIMRFPLAEGDL
jgi:hypothetical protein